MPANAGAMDHCTGPHTKSIKTRHTTIAITARAAAVVVVEVMLTDYDMMMMMIACTRASETVPQTRYS
jgi:hypothetical protein